MLFGEKVRQARLSRNLSQAELSEKTGLSIRSLYTYEQKNVIPRSEYLVRIAEALEVSTIWLLSDLEAGDSSDEYGTGPFLETVRDNYGQSSVMEANQPLERVGALFAGGELDDDDKEAFIRSVMEVYLESKAESPRQFSKGERKKRKNEEIDT